MFHQRFHNQIIREAGEKDQKKKKVQPSICNKFSDQQREISIFSTLFFFYTISHSFMLEFLNWAQG
jgi:hypothetical protein